MQLNPSFKTLYKFELFGRLSARCLHSPKLRVASEGFTTIALNAQQYTESRFFNWQKGQGRMLVCVLCIWQSEGTGNASEGDPTWDTVPTKIINTSLPMPDSPSQPGHRRHLSGKGFAFGSNNLNMCKAISLGLWTPGHTTGHLATGVPFCALKQTGTTGP